MPLRFWPGFGVAGAMRETFRILSNRMARLDPLVRRTYRAASAVLAVSPDTARYVTRIVKDSGKIEIIPLIGVSPDCVDNAGCGGSGYASVSSGRMKALFVGRLVHWKGVHLAIQALALAHVQNPEISLTILGSGPFAGRLERLVARLNLGEAVHFIRRVPTLDDVYALYREHHVFLFPSLHESGGMAVLEAMAAGLPALALDLGGPAMSVTSTIGVLVPCVSPVQVVEDLAAHLADLSMDTLRRNAMGRAAKERMKSGEYSWTAKAAAISDVYHTVAGQ